MSQVSRKSLGWSKISRIICQHCLNTMNVILHNFLPFSNQSTKKSFGASSTQTHTWGGGGNCGLLRSHQPAQPFVQDPAMPPLPPPNTLAQLEEACRRLEEVSTKTTKQRSAKSREQLPNVIFLKKYIDVVSIINGFLVMSVGIRCLFSSKRRATSCLPRAKEPSLPC